MSHANELWAPGPVTPDYLHDESRLQGRADDIAFPRTEAEVCALLAAAQTAGQPVTTQGARTGITGGAVPQSGHILNLSRMTAVTGLSRRAEDGAFLVRCQPGLTLAGLQEMLGRKDFDSAGWEPGAAQAAALFRAASHHFFPPDTTETSASLGGMAAANSSGACSYFYGPTRRYVESARIALPDGDVIDLQRGAVRASGRQFSLRTHAGREIAGRLPDYVLPDVKNAAGYYAADDMDMLDLFIGAEGTLGVFTELELRVIPSPASIWGVMFFFPTEADALRFVRLARGEQQANANPGWRKPAAIEFFDARTLRLLREGRADLPVLAELPLPPAGAQAMIYVEQHAESEEQNVAAVEALAGLAQSCGTLENDTWMGDSAADYQRLKKIRHAVPEAVNALIAARKRLAPEITKLGTDMAVPDHELEFMLSRYHLDLRQAGLEYVIFGHIGNNHLHVNILPRNGADYDAGWKLYHSWAHDVIARGGSISAEHGIGKLKTALLREMYGDAGIAQMRAVKKIFDPGNLLNRGNLFDPA